MNHSKQMALLIIMCLGQAMMARSPLKKVQRKITGKLSKKEVQKIKSEAHSAPLKQLEEDIKQLKKHGNKKAAAELRVILARRKLAKETKEAARAQKKEKQESKEQNVAVKELEEAEKDLKGIQESEQPRLPSEPCTSGTCPRPEPAPRLPDEPCTSGTCPIKK